MPCYLTQVKPISFSTSSIDVRNAVPSRMSCSALTAPPLLPTARPTYVPPTTMAPTTPQGRPRYTTKEKLQSCDYDIVSTYHIENHIKYA